jgi:hypothetical protein
LPLTGAEPAWLVPTETSSISLSQTSSLPAMFDYTLNNGDPLLSSSGLRPGSLCSTSTSASYTPPGGTVSAGFWIAEPTECGPYPAAGATPGTASIELTAATKTFDTAVTSATGDLWLQSVNPSSTISPLVLYPGATGTINVTITPSGASGTVVSGMLYVGALDNGTPPYYGGSGDELAAFPYSYTIK